MFRNVKKYNILRCYLWMFPMALLECGRCYRNCPSCLKSHQIFCHRFHWCGYYRTRMIGIWGSEHYNHNIRWLHEVTALSTASGSEQSCLCNIFIVCTFFLHYWVSLRSNRTQYFKGEFSIKLRCIFHYNLFFLCFFPFSGGHRS